MKASHAFRAAWAITARDLANFVSQYGRLLSAIVRPLLWLVVFAAGFQNALGVSIVPPYATYIPYQEYVVPGLCAMVLLFFGMQSALSLVYDREMGLMRLVLTAPLPRWYLLLAKIIAATLLGTAQVYVFLVVADLIGIELPAGSWLRLLPALLLVGLMLGSLGLLLSVTFKRIENFASTMNFVIFPMFFLSSALYPLWKLRESGAEWLYRLAWLNPFTHGVELIRFAAYGRFHEEAVIIVAACAILFFVLGAFLYNPQRGVLRRSRVAAPS